ncbi:Adhesion G-protein coupled receptor G2 [Holothuria leucospilota]|uniref:Adhesion G-protein coupled receptor G2 n=1 Tax=Holothuria leucospilota TaxID=206669 RepID=A0A9Q0YEJ7_HOLLE|nr:Adhesion G-protein coupled receptor G2 [Holothuria leucospilota]
MYNIIMYVIIIWNISFKRSSSQSNTTVIVRGLQNACFISVLLGVSWVFGFLAIGGARMTFNILFCLFNSFQGFFIFIFFCLRRREIREAWRNWFGIAICLKARDDPGVVQGKPSVSNVQPMHAEGVTVGTASSKITAESEKECSDSESIEDIPVTSKCPIVNEYVTNTTEKAKSGELMADRSISDVSSFHMRTISRVGSREERYEHE